MHGVIDLEGQPVGAQAVIIEVLEVELGASYVINDQAALLEQLDLPRVGGGRFGKGALHHQTLATKKEPAGLRIRLRA